MEQRSTQRTQRTQRVQNTMYASAQHTQVSAPDIFDEEYDDVWPPRLPNSTRRYRSDATMNTGSFSADDQFASQSGHARTIGKSVVPPRRTAAQTIPDLAYRHTDPDTEDFISARSGPLSYKSQNVQHLHWLGFVGIGMVVMLLGWVAFSLFTSWWTVAQDDLHYGRPRTFQTDFVVGHNDSATSPSHFIALNLNRHVQVIELPGGDAARAKVYMGPILVGPGQDLSPVTLTFKDVNGDGKLDLIVNVQGSHFVFINDNGQFRTPHQGEIINTSL
ncbi:MAG: hypothetical protein NVS2B12_27610 [Ktedonobacteraceae bacterium]